MPVRGTGMRLICPWTAQALSGLGTGALFAALAATISKVTVVVARLPAESTTV